MRKLVALAVPWLLLLSAAGQQQRGLERFRQLATASLDAKQVFHIRDCDLDLEDLHLTLEEGTIAFLNDSVNGRPTGAYFVGEGTVLAIPPNQVERASLARFTKSAVLNERLHSVFLRFSDAQTYGALKGALRAPEPDSDKFVSGWDPLIKNLSPSDALHLTALTLNNDPQRFAHALIGGDHLGVFDAIYDQAAPEAVLVAQSGRFAGSQFEDVWLSFSSKSQRSRTTTERSRGAGEISHTDQLQAGQNGLSYPLDIDSYAIKAQVSPPTDIGADATLRFSVLNRPVSAVIFQLARKLKVSSVELDGSPVEFLQNPPVPGSQVYRSGNDLVMTIFPAALEPKVKHELRFRYAGAVMTDTLSGLLYVGDRGTWFPNFGFRNADFDLTFTVPDGWNLISTGKPVAEKGALHFITERSVPVAGFNVGRFSLAHSAPGSGAVAITAMSTEHTDEGNATSPQEVVRKTADTVRFLEQHLTPFPYTHLSVTEVPGGISQGWPGLIYLSTEAFKTPKLGALPSTEFANIVFKDLMLQHEIGHQYWGDNVSWRSYREQWIMEALANYCALMLLEQQDPKKSANALEHYRLGLLRPGIPAAPVTLGQRLDSSQSPDGYVLLTYARGTWLVHMLRSMMRDAQLLSGGNGDPDQPFWDALRDLQTKFSGEAMGERDFAAAFAAHLPKSLHTESEPLAWFFSDWVNGASVPRFILKDVKIAGTAATGTIMTTEIPKDFTAVLPLYAADASGKLTLVAQITADEAEASFKTKVPAGTAKIVLDPNHEVLRRD